MATPVHEHDCDDCTFIASYPLRHPHYVDPEDGYRLSGYEPGSTRITMGDVYIPCYNSSYKYIVRYGIQGEYATTNVPSRYVKSPLIDGIDPYALQQRRQHHANHRKPAWR
jgi:hypothetical protein